MYACEAKMSFGNAGQVVTPRAAFFTLLGADANCNTFVEAAEYQPGEVTTAELAAAVQSPLGASMANSRRMSLNPGRFSSLCWALWLSLSLKRGREEQISVADAQRLAKDAPHR
jgi:hypothetical protein